MCTLLFVTSGNASGNGLSHSGKKQAKQVIPVLKSQIGEAKPVFMSATSNSVAATAKIVCDSFNHPFEKKGFLCSCTDCQNQQNNFGAYSFFKEHSPHTKVNVRFVDKHFISKYALYVCGTENIPYDDIHDSGEGEVWSFSPERKLEKIL